MRKPWSGDDLIFGDRGTVDLFNNGTLITRLGIDPTERNADPVSALYVPPKLTDGSFNTILTAATRDNGLGDDDILIGDLGNDRIWGSAGSDVMLGGLGNVLRSYASNGGILKTDVLLLDAVYLNGSVALDAAGMPKGDLSIVNALLEADLVLLAGAVKADGSRSLLANGDWDARTAARVAARRRRHPLRRRRQRRAVWTDG